MYEGTCTCMYQLRCGQYCNTYITPSFQIYKIDDKCSSVTYYMVRSKSQMPQLLSRLLSKASMITRPDATVTKTSGDQDK